MLLSVDCFETRLGEKSTCRGSLDSHSRTSSQEDDQAGETPRVSQNCSDIVTKWLDSDASLRDWLESAEKTAARTKHSSGAGEVLRGIRICWKRCSHVTVGQSTTTPLKQNCGGLAGEEADLERNVSLDSPCEPKQRNMMLKLFMEHSTLCLEEGEVPSRRAASRSLGLEIVSRDNKESWFVFNTS